MELTTENTEIIFMDCLLKEGEDTAGAIAVEGVMSKFWFHPRRLGDHENDISHLLSQLPAEFMADGGGGWSFLNACVRVDGVQWAEHITIEQLFALGQALGLVQCLLPRSAWPALPGGMPYYSVRVEGWVNEAEVARLKEELAKYEQESDGEKNGL